MEPTGHTLISVPRRTTISRGDRLLALCALFLAGSLVRHAQPVVLLGLLFLMAVAVLSLPATVLPPSGRPFLIARVGPDPERAGGWTFALENIGGSRAVITQLALHTDRGLAVRATDDPASLLRGFGVEDLSYLPRVERDPFLGVGPGRCDQFLCLPSTVAESIPRLRIDVEFATLIGNGYSVTWEATPASDVSTGPGGDYAMSQ